MDNARIGSALVILGIVASIVVGMTARGTAESRGTTSCLFAGPAECRASR